MSGKPTKAEAQRQQQQAWENAVRRNLVAAFLPPRRTPTRKAVMRKELMNAEANEHHG